MRLMFHTALGLVCAISGTLAAADWPSYRGPNNDGISTEKTLSSWPASGPKVLWKINVGQGIGSFAVKGDRAYFTVAVNDRETCQAISTKNGSTLWTTPFDRGFMRDQDQGGPGTSATSTPAIDGDKVYALSSYLVLACFNAADGKILWQHDIDKEFDGQNDTPGIDRWGNAASPVIEGDLVLVAGGGPGQSFLAFNKTTGAVVWKKHDELLTQATPTPATIAGVRQVIFFMQSGLVSLDPKTGDILWKQPHEFRTAIGASPVVSGDIVFYSVGYGVGGAASRITKIGNTFTATQLWRTSGSNMNHWSTPVVKDGYLYGIFGASDPKGSPLKCVELASGKEMWTGPAVGQGEVLLIDGKLIIQSANGKLMLADPNPRDYKEISATQPLAGQAWGSPSYSDGILLYRTNLDQAQMAALDLSAR